LTQMAGKRAAIIFNPASGRPGRRASNAREMARLLDQRGIPTEVFATQFSTHASQIAAQSIADGANIIISYGGDGTLNEIIQSMSGTDASLAIWPGGTANVAAVELGMPSRIEQLADIIAAGKTRRISLGLSWSGNNAKENEEAPEKSISDSPTFTHAYSQRYFFMFAGIGLDASIARNVNLKLKRVTGEFAFWVEGLRHLATWEPEIFTVEADGKKFESAFALIGNGSRYGGGISVTPGAKLEEPWFEVYILPPQPNKGIYLRNLLSCLRGKPEETNAITVRASHIKANSSHKPWVEVDGEVIGPLPMSFEIVPDALSVIVP
jgi:diacylglycerol kinase (ATP)